MGERTGPRLAALAALGLLVFGFPVLAVFDVPQRVLGVPVLWGYVFCAWGLVVALAAVVAAQAPRE